MRVAENLNLDMTWILDVSFNVKPAIAKIALTLAPGSRYLDRERIKVTHNTHPLAAAARRRLYEERCANCPGAFFESTGIMILYWALSTFSGFGGFTRVSTFWPQ